MLAHLSAALIHNPPAILLVTNKEVIDPVLLERGNCSPNIPAPDYQLPGATIDQILATTPNKHPWKSNPTNKKAKGNRGSINKVQGPKSSGIQKLVKKNTGKKTVQTENELLAPETSTRACKHKLNPNGEEFVVPKKTKHA